MNEDSMDANRILEKLETGATLDSGTTVGGNIAIHKGNMSTELDADTVDGKDASDLNRRSDSGKTRHLDMDTFALRNWYTFNEGGGSNVDNQTGVGTKYGETRGGVSWITGRNGNALSFDGTDDYVPLHDFFTTSGELDTFTVTVWFRSSASSPGWAFIDYDRSEYFNCSFETGGNGALQFATTDTGSSSHDLSTSSTWNDGNWHMAAFIYDGDNKRIIVDGNLDGFADSPHGADSIGSGTTRYGMIGDGSEASSFDGSQNDEYYEGDIDEIRFYYNRALTSSEAEAIYNDNA